MRLLRRSTPAGQMTFEVFGVAVQLSFDDSELEAPVRKMLPPGWRPCPPAESAGRFGLRQMGEDSYDVVVGDQPSLRDAALDVALGLLDAQIRLYVAANARDWIFAHAGVVADRGRGLVIPGESFSGKTTLVKALVERGATYYSDEYAVFDQEGRLHPYPRRLSLRTPSTTEDRDATELGGTVGSEAVELAVLAVTRYRPGSEWQPNRLTAGQGLAALLAHTVPAWERPRQSLRVLGRALNAALVLEGDRGEAGSVADALLEELSAIELGGDRRERGAR